MKTKTRPIYVIGFLLAGGVLVWLASLVSPQQKPDAFPLTLDKQSQRPVQQPTDPGSESFQAIHDRPEVHPDLYFEHLRKAYSWPIEFHGKVVDQDGNPVPGADVYFTWAKPPPHEYGNSATIQSGTDGFFELKGAVGRTLTVSVVKRGYYFPDGQRIGFNYAPNDGNFKADPKNPVIFRLKKKGPGVELITSQYGVRRNFDFSLPKDGSPMWIDFFERKVGTSGQLQVSKLTPERIRGGSREAKEWRVTLSIPDGGFVEFTDEEFPFYPPETGYQPMLDFHFPPDREGWTDTIKRQYYIAFGNPRRYGRIKIDTGMYWGIRLEYAVNPDGRPYLEPK